MPIMNLSNVDTSNTVPAGRYTIEVASVELREGKNSGEPYYNMRVTIVDHDDYSGRGIFTMLSFSERALPITVRALRALGLDDDDLAEWDIEADLFELVGRSCDVKIGITTYEGEDQNQIKTWYMS